MHRAYKSGAIGTPPSVLDATSLGYPTSGDPGGGIPATVGGPYHDYMITEELIALLLEAGITPAAATLTQVRDAVVALASRSGGAVYTPSMQDVQDFAAAVAVVGFVVPAGTWADGEVISVDVFSLDKNNKGSDGTPSFAVTVGAGSPVTLTNGTAWSDSGTEYPMWRGFTLIRNGSTVVVFAGYEITGSFGAASPVSFSSRPGAVTQILGLSSPASFAADITVSLIATLGAASPTYYYKPRSARIRKR